MEAMADLASSCSGCVEVRELRDEVVSLKQECSTCYDVIDDSMEDHKVEIERLHAEIAVKHEIIEERDQTIKDLKATDIIKQQSLACADQTAFLKDFLGHLACRLEEAQNDICSDLNRALLLHGFNDTNSIESLTEPVQDAALSSSPYESIPGNLDGMLPPPPPDNRGVDEPAQASPRRNKNLASTDCAASATAPRRRSLRGAGGRGAKKHVAGEASGGAAAAAARACKSPAPACKSPALVSSLSGVTNLSAAKRKRKPRRSGLKNGSVAVTPLTTADLEGEPEQVLADHGDYYVTILYVKSERHVKGPESMHLVRMGKQAQIRERKGGFPGGDELMKLCASKATTCLEFIEIAGDPKNKYLKKGGNARPQTLLAKAINDGVICIKQSAVSRLNKDHDCHFCTKRASCD